MRATCLCGDCISIGTRVFEFDSSVTEEELIQFYREHGVTVDLQIGFGIANWLYRFNSDFRAFYKACTELLHRVNRNLLPQRVDYLVGYNIPFSSYGRLFLFKRSLTEAFAGHNAALTHYERCWEVFGFISQENEPKFVKVKDLYIDLSVYLASLSDYDLFNFDYDAYYSRLHCQWIILCEHLRDDRDFKNIVLSFWHGASSSAGTVMRSTFSDILAPPPSSGSSVDSQPAFSDPTAHSSGVTPSELEL